MTDDKRDDAKKADESVPIQSLGGIARREALTAERRSEIASEAAKAMWAQKRSVRATHKGNFKEHFGTDVECYVLDDQQRTAVISQRGMAAALGLGQSSGANLQRFVKSARMAPLLGVELRHKLENPLR